MNRLPLLLVLVLPIATAADSPPLPRIEFGGSGGPDGGGVSGQGDATTGGRIILPPGWKLSIHTLTIRFAKDGGGTTLNALAPVKGTEFHLKTKLKSGSYKAWACIDVKDLDGKERQITSDSTDLEIP